MMRHVWRLLVERAQLHEVGVIRAQGSNVCALFYSAGVSPMAAIVFNPANFPIRKAPAICRE